MYGSRMIQRWNFSTAHLRRLSNSVFGMELRFEPNLLVKAGWVERSVTQQFGHVPCDGTLGSGSASTQTTSEG